MAGKRATVKRTSAKAAREADKAAPAAGKKASGKKFEDVAVVWVRKCLRLHDNAALVQAVKSGAKHICPIFILDPRYGPKSVGVNRYRFLLESLSDLDAQLKKKGSKLLVLKGKPETIFAGILRTGRPLLKAPPRLVLWEKDTEPYAIARDAAVEKMARSAGVEVQSFSGHTLWDPEEALKKCKNKPPSTMPGMVSLAKNLREPAKPLPAPSKVQSLPKGMKAFPIPTLQAMGYKAPKEKSRFPGGESAGLARLSAKLRDGKYVRTFEKRLTRSTAFNPPSTTVLSPYMKFGCVSARQFYHGLKKVLAGGRHTQPPGSLIGQLYFREMAYLQGLSVPNFGRAKGNPACRPIPWNKNAKFLAAWEAGKTGYPFIDAAMRQLKAVGWIHHLARHAVSCFLTRGDLWISWEQGRDVFDKLLLDADWAINTMNWLALSGVSSWSPPYFRVYHPSPKMDSALNPQDPEGHYIREFVPELRKMPSKYIYAPWEAPLEVQKKAGCVIGKNYPKPIVDHEKVSKANIEKFRKALSSGKRSAGAAAGGAAKKARR